MKATTFEIPTRPLVDTRHTVSGKFDGLPTNDQRDSDETQLMSESPDLPSEPSSSSGDHDMEVAGLPSTMQSGHQVSNSSRDADIPEDDLGDQIYQAHVQSCFPIGYQQDFMPNDKLDDLVTDQSVTQTLFADEAHTVVNEQMHALITYVLKSAKRLFVISLLCGLSGDRLKMSMKSFHSNSFSDGDLPLTSLESLEQYAAFNTRAWPKLGKKLFMSMQWKLLSPVFPQGFSRLDLRQEHILPFTRVAPERREGNFGAVYQVTIHPAHQDDPVRKVRQLRSF